MYEALSNSANEELSAIAQKSLKEVKYHYTHASSWMKIFAQGTEESRQRLRKPSKISGNIPKVFCQIRR
jgi:ring-1,2-phenylacetyl-CoA epoxidase subunit PaaC